VLALVLAEWVEGNKELCKEIASDEASKKTSLTKSAMVKIKEKIVERKEGGWWSGGHTWPPLNSHFHSSPHLAPLMLTPLTKSIKSKANYLYLFPKFYLFLFDFFRFYDMQ
jgi:hypothetical protein